MTKLLTVNEIADFLKVSRATVYNLVNKKGLPLKKVGKQTRFDVDEVFDWMEETNNHPKVKKFLTKIVDKKTGKETIHEAETFQEHADYLIQAIKDKTPDQEFFIAEEMEE